MAAAADALHGWLLRWDEIYHLDLMSGHSSITAFIGRVPR
jgi:hypothetical protein